MADPTSASSARKQYSAREILGWFHMLPEDDIKVIYGTDCLVVELLTRTTRPRVSSLATRTRLILQEKLGRVDVEVIPMGRPPEANDQIGMFRIEAIVRGVDWRT